jgi:UDPglucose 6-dehydrogenase
MGIAVNPEFLAEGTAIRDFVLPDRVVVGVTNDADAELLREVYAPILDRRLRNMPGAEGPRNRDEPVPFLVMAPQTAELLKYAANAFLAVKISFINEVSSIADELGADVAEVARGLGLDRRIGPHFLKAGIGWGGSCFPKDILALRGMAESRGVAARMLRAAHEVNAEQHRWVIRKLQRHLKTLVGRRVAMLGLAFKPNTDDLRNAPSLEIASELAKLNARVRAYDPAVKAVPPALEGALQIVSDPYAAAESADAAVLVTEWPEFRDLDLRRLRETMSEPLLLDGRNFLDRAAVEGAGFIYVGVGR